MCYADSVTKCLTHCFHSPTFWVHVTCMCHCRQTACVRLSSVVMCPVSSTGRLSAAEWKDKICNLALLVASVCMASDTGCINHFLRLQYLSAWAVWHSDGKEILFSSCVHASMLWGLLCHSYLPLLLANQPPCSVSCCCVSVRACITGSGTSQVS